MPTPDDQAGDPSSHARLTAWHAGALVVGSMIGTGVFTTSGLLMGTIGSRAVVLLVWALGGVLALMGAAVYAELGAMMPRVGGEYVYLSRAFSPALGFLSGWIALLVGFAAPIAAGAAAFAQYAEAAWPGIPGSACRRRADRSGDRAARARRGVGRPRATGDHRDQRHSDAGVGPCRGLGGAGARGPARRIRAGRRQGGYRGGAGLDLVGRRGRAGAGLVQLLRLERRRVRRGRGAPTAVGPCLPRALCIGCALVTALYVAINAVFLAALSPAALAGKMEIAHLAAQNPCSVHGGARAVGAGRDRPPARSARWP